MPPGLLARRKACTAAPRLNLTTVIYEVNIRSNFNGFLLTTRSES